MWLLTQEAFDAMERYQAQSIEISEESIQAITAQRGSEGTLTVKDGVGVIPIEGVLTKQPDLMAMLFGGGNTLYSDINASLAEADADPKVEEIELHVGWSPGGNVSGLFPTIDAIRATKKPVHAVVDDMAASATYSLIAQADTITASSDAVAVGSIGIVGKFQTSENTVEITSTNAPNKRPDVKTDEGKAVVREHLDEYEALFIDAIAAGRGTSSTVVKQNFGQGAVVLSQRAKRMGMIDAIAPKIQPTAAISGVTKQEVKAMDLKELMATHPGIYDAAVQIGVEQERKRATAHLLMGKASGVLDIAIGAVENGDEYDAAFTARYQAAAIEHQAIVARENDNPTVLEPAGTPDADVNDKAKQFDAKVAAAMSYGLDMEALNNG